MSAEKDVPQAKKTGSGYQLLVVYGDEFSAFTLPASGQVSIGRAETSSIRIDHPSVSRLHARLTLGTQILVEDLGGANGTFVRDRSGTPQPGQTQPLRRLVKQAAEVVIGEQLLFGAVSVVLRALPQGSVTPVVQSEAMRGIYSEATRVARSTLSVLLLGETGVGKEVLARSVHLASARAEQPFLGINCAAISESVLEGELFGYERGAFTGALQARAGLFEAADRGSLFLDEIGDLPLQLQAKLLRVLEDRSVLRIGARSTRSVDIRIIAATNRDLDADVEAGRFRRDLLYRLNAVVLTIPPLRERTNEIAALVETFVASACQQLRRPKLHVPESVVRQLEAHAWPGNVRELRNVIERATVLCEGAVLAAEHLPRAWSRAPLAAEESEKPNPASRLGPQQMRAEVHALQRGRLVEALESCGGNQTRAAELLGISRRTLVKRMSQFDMPRPKKKQS